jgi:hypothetical protein
MGYDLHITGRRDWSDTGHDIRSSEWLSLVTNDPELRLDTTQGPFFAVWSGPSQDAAPWLDWRDGQIFTKNPDAPLIDKMIQLAQALGATVQGDDGELYRSGAHRPRVSTMPASQPLIRRLGLILSQAFSLPRLPPPPFRVGDRVTNLAGETATVVFINRRANYGYGRVRVRFDDGREPTFPLFAHNLAKVDPGKHPESA